MTRSLGSVLTQTERDWECVVVDDGSTVPVDLGALGEDPRVRLVRQENHGVSVARNVGVSVTDSQTVAFLDQDDEWLPDKLERQMSLLAHHPETSFVYSPFWWMGANGALASGHDDVNFEASLAGRCYVCLSSVLVDRMKHDAVGGHHSALAQQQDWDFLLRLLRVFGRPQATSERLVRYYVHGDNASRDYWRAEWEARSVLRMNALDNGSSVAVAVKTGRARTRQTHSYQAIDAARETLHHGDLIGTLNHFTRAFRLDPKVGASAVVSALGTRVPGRDIKKRG